jgi:hypothetical protein
MFDQIIKVLFLTVAVFATVLLYRISCKQNQNRYSIDGETVFDTKTGKIYVYTIRKGYVYLDDKGNAIPIKHLPVD